MPQQILVAACQDQTHQAICELLRRSGLPVHTATTVSEAMGALDRNPWLMIVDLAMADGNGLDVIKAARSESRQIKIAAVSGPGDAHQSDWIAKYSPDAVFGKPFDFSDFVGWLSEFDQRESLPIYLPTLNESISQAA